jgi:hypothetical protein
VRVQGSGFRVQDLAFGVQMGLMGIMRVMGLGIVGRMRALPIILITPIIPIAFLAALESKS